MFVIKFHLKVIREYVKLWLPEGLINPRKNNTNSNNLEHLCHLSENVDKWVQEQTNKTIELILINMATKLASSCYSFLMLDPSHEGLPFNSLATRKSILLLFNWSSKVIRPSIRHCDPSSAPSTCSWLYIETMWNAALYVHVSKNWRTFMSCNL